MAFSRQAYSKGKRRGKRGAIAMPAFDPDRNRGEIYPDPKDPALDYSPFGPEPRKPDLKPRVIMPAKPLGCECGHGDFIQIGPRWVCVNCNPHLTAKQQQTPAREIVTIPASLASDAAGLVAAWELIQAKRAAAGLAALPKITGAKRGPKPKNKKQQPGELDAEFLRRWDIFQAQQLQRRGYTFPPIKCNPSKDDIEGETYTTLANAQNIVKQLRKEDINPEKYIDITFFSHMGIAAARRFSKLGGAWRLYVLAKALDKNGLGMIARDDLKAWLLSLGVNVRTFERWIKQARNYGLIIDVQAQSGEWLLRLVNAGIAGAALNCETAGRRVTMPAGDLIGKGWKARVWSAYMATHNGQPISRDKMQKIVNVAISTQRYRDAQAGRRVKRIRNYAKTKMRGDMLQGLLDFSKHKGIFIDGAGFINWRLPNSYQVKSAFRGGKGRGRKINKIIRSIQATNGLYQMQQALSLENEYNSEIVKLFNRNPKQQKSALKKLAKIDNRKVKDIYQESHTAKTGAVIWTHCPV